MANLLKEALGGMLTFRHRINECICQRCLVYFPKQFVNMKRIIQCLPNKMENCLSWLVLKAIHNTFRHKINECNCWRFFCLIEQGCIMYSCNLCVIRDPSHTPRPRHPQKAAKANLKKLAALNYTTGISKKAVCIMMLTAEEYLP